MFSFVLLKGTVEKVMNWFHMEENNRFQKDFPKIKIVYNM